MASKTGSVVAVQFGAGVLHCAHHAFLTVEQIRSRRGDQACPPPAEKAHGVEPQWDRLGVGQSLERREDAVRVVGP